MMRAMTLLTLLSTSTVTHAAADAELPVDDVSAITYQCASIDDVLNRCATPGCGEGCGECVGGRGEDGCVLRFDADATSVLGDDNCIDSIFGCKDDWTVPVNVGGWHWWNIDTAGVGNGGYGADGYDGTYAYYTIANPSRELEDGRTLSGFVFFAGRDDANYRLYYDRKFWFLEGYVSLSDPEWGALKGGLVNTKFGLDGYLGFFGTAPYFDGFIQDPDYGFSWEKTSQPYNNISLETVVQYFIRDGEWNGGLRNHDRKAFPD